MGTRKLSDKQKRALAKGRRKLKKMRAVAKARGVSMKTVARSAKLMKMVEGTKPVRRRQKRTRARKVAKQFAKAWKALPNTVKRWF